jgi:2-keto-4-pentenoate hydratase/2-oxohepta-3-ene-1,7-dioic acid hydratase in catechol pathway
MRFVSFSHHDRQGFGLLRGDRIVDLTGKLSPDVVTLKQAIAAGLLAQVGTWQESLDDIPVEQVRLLPVVPDPGKILCIGLNYEDHRAETARPTSEFPTVFTRFAESQVGHRQPLHKPAISDRFDYEAELAIVIRAAGYQVREEHALDLVAGYACYNDGSVRDWQRHTSQFTPGKNFPATGGFGPALVTPDEVGDYRQLPIQLRLNGQVMQDAKLSDLIFPIEKLIAYCSTFTPLAPGDVIVTGTPGGVGDRRQPPVYLRDGDWIEVDIGVVGCLVNPVITPKAGAGT